MVFTVYLNDLDFISLIWESQIVLSPLMRKSLMTDFIGTLGKMNLLISWLFIYFDFFEQGFCV